MSTESDQENEAQDNFVEGKEPSELVFCLLLASAYLGLAKFCFTPLLRTQNWKLLFNVEGFFVATALVAIVIGARPYMAPSSLQISYRGFKYRGAYWTQRRTVNWDQVERVYLSPELILVLYRSNPKSKWVWPMAIFSVYLAERQNIVKSFIKYCPIEPIMMRGPALISWIILGLIITGVVIWYFYLLTPG